MRLAWSARPLEWAAACKPEERQAGAALDLHGDFESMKSLSVKLLVVVEDDRPEARSASAALDLHVDFESRRSFSVKPLAVVEDDRREARRDCWHSAPTRHALVGRPKV
jgi:hypothetical protein